MRLSDLLDHDVVDEAGHDLGIVHEVHLVQDGPQVAGGTQTLLLHGLYVGSGTVARRVGYARGIVRGPWLVGALLAHGRVRYVPWERVSDIADRITVSGDAFDLPSTAPGSRP